MSNKKNTNNLDLKSAAENTAFGADPEEQTMNGLYGILETKTEDNKHHINK
ncbi:DUF4021 domain-containing protein [Heyndrickxia ginsengihumi]|uniref:DUF4021 domain-containing protein n=1 Tax=Heyndrickxia ginsengihumi TaxID=363870 RepID=A0A6M0P9L4_9BACI|nr:DUF4021 domain-containing protein [Heyndrickxia ginsengihumi]MBE6184634.1 DUF4021 domain-containing protein [Bacillus sp. (in: firmicutes)]MCM3024254.1 DUF4021 domain-containing protein [Heyndrickxia ginsengihumi]NEY20610.1 DUF4021 domain-containing protein [Heyndrickxia ginsengihumi]